MLTTAKRVLFWAVHLTWGLPQTLVGLALWLVLYCKNRRVRRSRYRCAAVTRWGRLTSLCIGPFLFMSIGAKGESGDRLLAHEYGHSLQSLLLGPLYIPVILLPSALWCNLPAARRHRRNTGRGYYTFYTERWANHLAVRATGAAVPDWK